MKQSKFVKLGQYIEQCDERNADNKYGLSALRGVSINKTFIDSKANMEGVSLTPYKLVKPLEMCYVTITSRNGDKISLAINQSEETYIVSSSYVVLRVKDKNTLDPEYLFMLFNRPEFDRYSRFNSWGSAREAFSYESMELTQIPLPSIDKQREIVNVWKSLKRLKEQNEKISEPLMALCRSKLKELRDTLPLTALDDYIEQSDQRNYDGYFGESDVRGLATSKEMIATKANLEGVSLTSYKLFKPQEFAYVPDTSRRGDKVSMAFNGTNNTHIVSSISCVFRVKPNKELIPDYLFMFFLRPEFDRYARFNSWGSARETFSWEEMKRVKIPIPSKEVQRAIVDIYQCAQRAKTIATEADQQLKTICPALIQYVVNN